MRKLIFALAFGATLLPSHGFALGLGEIEVNSALNQKLAARIDLLSAAPEEAESLLISLASREEFLRAGLDRPMVLSTLKFETRIENGDVFVDVTSPKPIREPFLNFLLEVDWPQGHLIREYTLLLDPPVFMGRRDSQAAPASGRPAMRTADSRPQSTGTSVPPVSAPAPMAAAADVSKSTPSRSYAAPAAPATERRVQAGDTAWSLANSMRPNASVSTQQMLLALLRANPGAFINDNVNGLKRGYILRTPDADDIKAASSEEARAIVRRQNAMWREYQQSSVSDEPASALNDDYSKPESGSSAVNRAASNNSRLAIVSAGAGSSAENESKNPSELSASELREQLALARERVETERVEKENLQKQVSSLAQQVDEMKSLLSIEDDALAEIQSVGRSSEETNAVDQAAEVTDEETITETDTEVGAQDTLKTEAEDEAAEIAADGEAVFTDEASEPVAVVAPDTEVMMDEAAPAESDYVQKKDTSLMGTLLDNRMLLGGLLLLLLIIGALAYLIKRRRNNASNEAEESGNGGAFAAGEENALEDVADTIDAESIDEVVNDEDVKASMAEAELKEEEFDAEATMSLPSDTDTAVTSANVLQAEEPEEEQDDVLAEADVYLAYGIYQQAEELLEAAIAEHPDKDSYRVKLAETYFAGKNAEAFEKLGVEMKQRLGNEESPAWIKVAAMGKELCPDAEVFQQADLDVDLDINDLMPKSPEPMDFDLGEIDNGGADESVPELDMDFDAPLDEPSEETGFDLPSLEETPDELEFDLSETDALEETPAETSAPHETPDELEFDLSETDALEEASAETSALEDPEAPEALVELEFDMSEAATEEAATEEAETENAATELSSDDDEEEEFSLDIEASELDLEDSAETDEADLDFDISMDAETETETEEAAPVNKTEEKDDELDTDFSTDMSDEAAPISKTEEDDALDTEFGLDMSEKADVESEEGEFDLSAEAADYDLSVDEDLEGMDLSEPLDADEINTKLDLARAYLDMGDHEGARDILEEVVEGGNAEQKKEAEDLMAQAG
ncbi:MAG: hypothetical protein PF589_06385 [Gammaproteobacteria bacterium]|nr:hypothetical protein [Gammaproteobacteria bacterium]